MATEPIVALEIGTSKVRAMVGDTRADGFISIIGLGECPSRGVRKGEVVDFDNAKASVQSALKQAEENSRTYLADVHLALSGGHIQSLTNRGTVPILTPNHEITAREINHVMQTGRAVTLPPDRDVLHTISRHFYVDDQNGVVNPEGMEGATLSVDMLILHGIRTRLRNMVRLIKSLKYEILDVVFSGLCSAQAVLTREEKTSGVALLDLGGGKTDYVVYANSAIGTAGSIAVGGDHVNNDIACGLRVSIVEAERLKHEHGQALVELAARSQKISVLADPPAIERVVRLADLQTIIYLRMEELFTLIRTRLQELKLLHLLGGGIVLTGGGARLPQVDRLAEKVFGLPCRIGLPHNVSGLGMVTEAPEYATTVGLIRYAFKSLDRRASGSVIDQLKRLWTKSRDGEPA